MSDGYAARDLVTSHEYLDANMKCLDLVEWFKNHPGLDFAAVINDIEIVGLVGREHMNSKLAASSVAHSLYSHRAITMVMLPGFIEVDGRLPVHDLVTKILQERQGSSEFYDDIIVHDDGVFLGLASIKQLIVKQMDQITRQMAGLEKQQASLVQKNKELVESTLRLSADQTQLKAIFETCSVPIVIFDRVYNFVEANHRFYQLSGYEADHLKQGGNSSALFGEGLHRMLGAFASAQKQLGGRKPTYILTLHHHHGEDFGVEVSFEWNDKGDQMVLSILRVLEKEEAATHDMVLQRIAQESDLVKKVVSNLIDKESKGDIAMQKVDQLIEYARQLDQNDARIAQGAAAEGAPADLRGNLGEFSMIDLAQLLVQGHKTGRLTISSSDDKPCQVYFEQGRIVHARSNGTEGRAILTRLMTMQSGSFIFNYDIPTPQRTIDTDPMSLLLDACAEADHFQN